MEIIIDIFRFFVEIFIRIFIEFLFERVLYYLGYAFSKIFTLGVYPKEKDEKNENRFPLRSNHVDIKLFF